MSDLFFLYGPAGSGKRALGRLLAQRLDLPFVDLQPADAPTPAAAGHATCVAERLRKAIAAGRGVVALAPATLRVVENQRMVDAAGAAVLCLGVAGAADEADAEHYEAFAHRLALDGELGETDVDAAQVALGAFRVRSMGHPYSVRIGPELLERLDDFFQRHDWSGRTVVVGDEHTQPLLGSTVVNALNKAGLRVQRCTIPAGEATKTIDTVQAIWRALLAAHIERGDTVVALGGGVVGDLTGFAAATWLRGVRWVGLPTSLLAMVDSSLGGKTGADLPQGKNLIGAFHAPALVLADTDTLGSLPDDEFRAGLAEVVKHGIIADPELFDLCAEGFDNLRADVSGEFVSRAVAVKVRTIEQDPYEKGIRAALNLGHTIGHGIEKATDFSLRHGEAVAIGLVLEARIAERMKLAHAGLADLIAGVLEGLGLPTAIPRHVDRNAVAAALQLDKKRAGGIVRFALPTRIGDVRVGVAVDPAFLNDVLNA